MQAAAGKETVVTYDKAGNLKTVTDADGNTTTYTYNSRNEEIAVKDALVETTSYAYAYDAAGNLKSITDPLHDMTTFTYDQLNDVAHGHRPLNETTTYTYNVGQEETYVSTPIGNTTAAHTTTRAAAQDGQTVTSSGHPLQDFATYMYRYDVDTTSRASTTRIEHHDIHV